MMKILDEDGDERGEVKFGQKPDGGILLDALHEMRFVKASGLELEECCRILGRPKTNGPHIFNWAATEEILLNWGL